MKKLLVAVVLLMSVSVFSQKTFPFVIEHCKDKMTETEYYFVQKKLICANPTKTKGFTISPNFKSDNGVVVFSGLICSNVNIGNCDENDSLIFLFQDDTKITISSWNKFNCEGNAYFYLTASELAELSAKKINTIRFTNGYSYDSFTHTLKLDQKDYFVRAFTKQKIVEVDCSK